MGQCGKFDTVQNIVLCMVNKYPVYPVEVVTIIHLSCYSHGRILFGMKFAG